MFAATLDWLARHWFASSLVEIALVSLFVRFRARRVLGPTLGAASLANGLLIVVVVWHVAFHPILPPDVPPSPPPVIPPPAIADPLGAPWNSGDASKWHVSSVLAELCDLAYLPPVDVEDKFAALGFQLAGPPAIDKANVAFVLERDEAQVVVFRGTDDQFDWIVNLTETSRTTVDGEFHEGFYSSYEKLRTQIEKLLARRPGKRLWITGHSLGGALALTCTFDLELRQGRTVDGLVTFGQPRTVRDPPKQRIQQVLHGRYACFVNERDVVPRIPPDFELCGDLVWFTGGGVREGVARASSTLQPVRFAPAAPAPPEFAELAALSADEFTDLKRGALGARNRGQFKSLEEAAKPPRAPGAEFSRWMMAPYARKSREFARREYDPDEREWMTNAYEEWYGLPLPTKSNVNSLYVDHSIAEYRKKIEHWRHPSSGRPADGGE